MHLPQLKLQSRPGPRAALCSLIDWLLHWWPATRSAATRRKKTHSAGTSLLAAAATVYTHTCIHLLAHASLPRLSPNLADWRLVGPWRVLITSFLHLYHESIQPEAGLMLTCHSVCNHPWNMYRCWLFPVRSWCSLITLTACYFRLYHRLVPRLTCLFSVTRILPGWPSPTPISVQTATCVITLSAPSDASLRSVMFGFLSKAWNTWTHLTKLRFPFFGSGRCKV